MLIAQITDLHCVEEGANAMGAVDTNAALDQAVARLNAFKPAPDLVIITGDLVDNGRPDQYRALTRRLNALRLPFVVLPGNHDDRGALVEAFPDHHWLPRNGGALNYVVEEYPVRIIALDTVIPGESGGALAPDTLVWLDERLGQEPDRPTVVAMHHPPFTVGITFMDRIACAGGDRMADVVARHRQVERVICGHVHRPVTVRFGGTLGSIAPSTAHQIPLALGDPGVADSWVREPAGFALFRWTGAQLVGHLAYLGEYGAPVAY